MSIISYTYTNFLRFSRLVWKALNCILIMIVMRRRLKIIGARCARTVTALLGSNMNRLNAALVSRTVELRWTLDW